MVKIALALLFIASAAAAYADSDAPPVSYQRFGNQIYGSDGSHAQTLGNQTYYYAPNGETRVCSTFGRQTYCN